jgi:hypothetical protein
MPFVRVEVGLRHVQRASASKDIKDKCERTITRVRDLTHEERGKLPRDHRALPVEQMVRQSSEIVSALNEDAITALV